MKDKSYLNKTAATRDSNKRGMVYYMAYPLGWGGRIVSIIGGVLSAILLIAVIKEIHDDM